MEMRSPGCRGWSFMASLSILVSLGLVVCVPEPDASTDIGLDTQGIATDQPAAYRILPETSIPNGFVSTRTQTLQNLVTVNSYLSCGGLGSSCACTKTSQKTEYQAIVNVDLPCGAGPFPIVWFWHGSDNLQTYDTNSYDSYVEVLNKAGYAVLQYDVLQSASVLKVTDAVELQFPRQILDWLKVFSVNPVSKFYQKFDFAHIAVAGHSHGGALAANVYGRDLLPNIFAAFLVDPVDCTCLWPCSSNCFPSGVQAIQGKGMAVGLVGATIKGCCNPTADPGSCNVAGNACPGRDYRDFLVASGNESSAAYQWNAGNAQFGLIVAGTPAHQVAANTFCGSNPTLNQVSLMSTTAEEMRDWITARLYEVAPSYASSLAPTGVCASGFQPAPGDPGVALASLPNTVASAYESLLASGSRLVAAANANVPNSLSQPGSPVGLLTYRDALAWANANPGMTYFYAPGAPVRVMSTFDGSYIAGYSYASNITAALPSLVSSGLSPPLVSVTLDTGLGQTTPSALPMPLEAAPPTYETATLPLQPDAGQEVLDLPTAPLAAPSPSAWEATQARGPSPGAWVGEATYTGLAPAGTAEFTDTMHMVDAAAAPTMSAGAATAAAPAPLPLTAQLPAPVATVPSMQLYTSTPPAQVGPLLPASSWAAPSALVDPAQVPKTGGGGAAAGQVVPQAAWAPPASPTPTQSAVFQVSTTVSSGVAGASMPAASVPFAAAAQGVPATPVVPANTVVGPQQARTPAAASPQATKGTPATSGEAPGIFGGPVAMPASTTTTHTAAAGAAAQATLPTPPTRAVQPVAQQAASTQGSLGVGSSALPAQAQGHISTPSAPAYLTPELANGALAAPATTLTAAGNVAGLGNVAASMGSVPANNGSPGVAMSGQASLLGPGFQAGVGAVPVYGGLPSLPGIGTAINALAGTFSAGIPGLGGAQLPGAIVTPAASTGSSASLTSPSLGSIPGLKGKGFGLLPSLVPNSLSPASVTASQSMIPGTAGTSDASGMTAPAPITAPQQIAGISGSLTYTTQAAANGAPDSVSVAADAPTGLVMAAVPTSARAQAPAPLNKVAPKPKAKAAAMPVKHVTKAAAAPKHVPAPAPAAPKTVTVAQEIASLWLPKSVTKTVGFPPAPLDPANWDNLTPAAKANRQRAAAYLKSRPARRDTPSEDPRAEQEGSGLTNESPEPGHSVKRLHISRTAEGQAGPMAIIMADVGTSDDTATTPGEDPATTAAADPALSLSHDSDHDSDPFNIFHLEGHKGGHGSNDDSHHHKTFHLKDLLGDHGSDHDGDDGSDHHKTFHLKDLLGDHGSGHVHDASALVPAKEPARSEDVAAALSPSGHDSEQNRDDSATASDGAPATPGSAPAALFPIGHDSDHDSSGDSHPFHVLHLKNLKGEQGHGADPDPHDNKDHHKFLHLKDLKDLDCHHGNCKLIHNAQPHSMPAAANLVGDRAAAPYPGVHQLAAPSPHSIAVGGPAGAVPLLPAAATAGGLSRQASLGAGGAAPVAQGPQPMAPKPGGQAAVPHTLVPASTQTPSNPSPPQPVQVSQATLASAGLSVTVATPAATPIPNQMVLPSGDDPWVRPSPEPVAAVGKIMTTPLGTAPPAPHSIQGLPVLPQSTNTNPLGLPAVTLPTTTGASGGLGPQPGDTLPVALSRTMSDALSGNVNVAPDIKPARAQLQQISLLDTGDAHVAKVEPDSKSSASQMRSFLDRSKGPNMLRTASVLKKVRVAADRLLQPVEAVRNDMHEAVAQAARHVEAGFNDFSQQVPVNDGPVLDPEEVVWLITDQDP